MSQGSILRHFVILQINTEQFPLEFINISHVNPHAVDAHRCICLMHTYKHPPGWEILIKQ